MSEQMSRRAQRASDPISGTVAAGGETLDRRRTRVLHTSKTSVSPTRPASSAPSRRARRADLPGGNDRGDTLPWRSGSTPTPPCNRSDLAAALHDATADFTPPAGATCRRPDVAAKPGDRTPRRRPYNAVWQQDRLSGFIDWRPRAPLRELDLATPHSVGCPYTSPYRRAARFTAFADRSDDFTSCWTLRYDGDRTSFGAQMQPEPISTPPSSALCRQRPATSLALLPAATDLEHAARDIEQLPETSGQCPQSHSAMREPMDQREGDVDRAPALAGRMLSMALTTKGSRPSKSV